VDMSLQLEMWTSSVAERNSRQRKRSWARLGDWGDVVAEVLAHIDPTTSALRQRMLSRAG
jgi:hypothetical protein